MCSKKLPVIPLERSSILIRGPFPEVNGASTTLNLGQTSVSSFTVTNLSITPVHLTAVRLAGYGKLTGFHGLVCYQSGLQSSVNSKNCNLVKNWTLQPNAKLSFFISCSPRRAGLHTARILCDFSHGRVIKNVSVLVEDPSNPVQERPKLYRNNHAGYKPRQERPKPQQCEKEPSTSSKASDPHKQVQKNRRRRKGFPPVKKIIPGVPPPAPSFVNRLKKYNMPKDMRKLFEKRKTPDILQEDLSPANYSKRFAALLWAEEFQMEIDIQGYNMKGVHMKRSDENLLALYVPNLAEKRPSVIYGDAIYVRSSGTCDKEYQGYVYRVTREEVHLRFHREFHATFDVRTRFDVRFSFGRTGLRRAHQALEAAESLINTFIFPRETNLSGRLGPSLHAINKSLNKEQLGAVNQILHKKGAPPYIVFGPPGTGKTVTLIEAILQVCKKNPNAVILACAPSNSAADLLLLRLSEFISDPRQILRLNSFSRFKEDIPSGVLPYCNEPQTGVGHEQLMSYKVIVCTYSSSSLLHAQDVPRGHFSHIFLDEAAQSTEPDTLIPIANLAKSDTVVALAGDHQQLGAVIHSETAIEFGLGTPLFERLISFPPYVANGSAYKILPSSYYRKELATKLVRNYRSHPSILEVPSKLFYAGELVACEGKAAKSLLKWGYWPSKFFPVVFVGVDGKDEQEADSPSWWNAAEVEQVLQVTERLKLFHVKSEEIGVITPYKKQVKKIRAALARVNIQGVKVGSVEEFQGLERRVTIVSTVRATKDNIGFVGNPKRFNVAITRAIAGLVVIGNPALLCQEPCWNEFIQYCLKNKSYKGCPIPPKEEKFNTP